MIEVTVEQFEKNFDSYMDRIESGEEFLIRQPDGRGVMAVPVNKLCQEIQETGDEELYNLYCNHDEGC